MKKMLLTFIFAAFLTGFFWNGSAWVPDNSVLTEFGRLPECTQTKIVKLEDGTYHQDDVCTEDMWGNDYAPWSTSGGASGE